MKEVYITRHCETNYNRDKLIQGNIDIDLNDVGISHARVIHNYFSDRKVTFDNVYSSPLKRAVQTSLIINEGKNIKMDERLREFDFGKYDGYPIDDFLFRQTNWDISEKSPPIDGMESNEGLINRTGSFIKDLTKKDFNKVLIVSHGRTIKSLIAVMNNWKNKELWQDRFPIGTIMKVEFIDNKFINFSREVLF